MFYTRVSQMKPLNILYEGESNENLNVLYESESNETLKYFIRG